MKGCLIVGGIALLVLLLVGGCGVGAYNGIVTKETAIEKAWSEIQNQYQRRYDLVPQLVATVQGAAEFEKSTLNEVTEARASVGKFALPAGVPEDPEKLKAFLAAQEQLAGALSRLIAVAESYPSLKATQNFLSLQDQLEGTENRLAVARGDYIRSVNDYNTAIRRFPAYVLAGMIGFEKHAQLEVPAGATERPAVQFDFGKK